LMAAGQAACHGGRVVLLEKMDRPGLKLGLSGKGRCNLTNMAPLEDFLVHFGPGGRFLRQPFSRFFAPELIRFFQRLGVEVEGQRGGRVFPVRLRAPQVAARLRDWARKQGVEIRTGFRVTGLLMEESKVVGVSSTSGDVSGAAVILATGGASYPATGSSGDGYGLAAAAGHRIVPVRPALVPLGLEPGLLRVLAGLHLRNTGVRLFVDGRRRGAWQGEVLFREEELAGAVILSLSAAVVDGLENKQPVYLLLDLKPGLDEVRLDRRLQRDFRRRCRESLESALRGVLPRPLVRLCLMQTGLAAGIAAGEVRRRDRKRLVQWMKNLRLDIPAHRGLARAIVTAGGVDLRQVDPRSMASRLVSGLYLAGELLDVQGKTGGYNLQAAFSTGWVAGRAAAGAE